MYLCFHIKKYFNSKENLNQIFIKKNNRKKNKNYLKKNRDTTTFFSRNSAHINHQIIIQGEV